MMEELRIGNLRIQFVSAEIVRAEYAEDGVFCDENTLFVPDRKESGNAPEYTVCKGPETITVCFDGKELSIPRDCKGLQGITLRNADGEVLCRLKKRRKNTGELPSVRNTPEVFVLSDCPRISVPEGGYTYRGEAENSGYKIEEKAQDVYFLLCGKDASKLRRLYVELTGRCEMIRLSTLGTWNSKYFVYDEESAKQVILDYEKYGVPLDNMVLDTDWRAASDRGIGYDVDTKLFPDMKRFLDFAHAHGVEIMFNDHPEPVDGAASVLSPAEVKYREEKLQGLMKLGLDVWWYDRNWHTALKSPVPEIRQETFGLYLFEEITRHYWQQVSGDKRKYRRPVVMGNVNNIQNGVYQEIGDSASHRFGMQWTGDIASGPADLRQEVKNLLRASDNCIAYVNADCGGHTGNPDKLMYLRWIQFGVLSPVFRPHCTNTVERFREPWVYDKDALNVSRNYIKMRYRLLPVIYQNAFDNYLTGTPIFRGLGWEYPEDKKAASVRNEYMLGKDLLIAPVAVGGRAMRSVYLPEGKWLNVFTGKVYRGGRYAMSCAYNETLLFVRLGALLPLAPDAANTKKQRWNKLTYDFYPDPEASDEGALYEDDGETTAYQSGEYRLSPYKAYFDREENAYVVRLAGAEGRFSGKRAFAKRSVTVRLHLLGQKVRGATLNGAEIGLERIARDSSAFPFAVKGGAREGEVLTATWTTSVKEDSELKFYLG